MTKNVCFSLKTFSPPTKILEISLQFGGISPKTYQTDPNGKLWIKRKAVKPLENIASICFCYWFLIRIHLKQSWVAIKRIGVMRQDVTVKAYPYGTNYHHSSIPSFYVADLLLGITLKGPGLPDQVNMNGLNLYIPNNTQKINFIPKFILINFIPRFILTYFFKSLWVRLTTTIWND